VRLRRFSQLGWQGCQDLAGFVMGEKVERVELGPAPDVQWEEPNTESSTGDGTEFLKVPGALLHVSREWAEAMSKNNPVMAKKLQTELDE
jgi:hypothetical protein